MDRNQQDQVAKLICIAVGCIIAFYVFMWLLPYIEMFLAICGACYLWQEYQKNNRRRF